MKGGEKVSEEKRKVVRARVTEGQREGIECLAEWWGRSVAGALRYLIDQALLEYVPWIPEEWLEERRAKGGEKEK